MDPSNDLHGVEFYLREQVFLAGFRLSLSLRILLLKSDFKIVTLTL